MRYLTKISLILLAAVSLTLAGSRPTKQVSAPTKYAYEDRYVVEDRISNTESSLLSSPLPELEGEIGGYTTYEHQSHGASGRRIAIDADGNAHIFWMDSKEEGTHNDRNIHYNVWNAEDEDFVWTEGVKSSAANRAGYVTCNVLEDGRAIETFHETQGAVNRSVFSSDAAPRFGTFQTPYTITGGDDIIWPQMLYDSDGNIHLTALSFDTADHKVYYSRSTDGGGTFSAWNPVIDFHLGSGNAMAASKNGKIAIVYCQGFATQGGYVTDWAADMYYIESTDGGATWSNAVNVTENRHPANPAVGQETDPIPWPTYNGISGMQYAAYDEDGNLHIVFQEVLGSLHETDANSMYIYDQWYSRLVHWTDATDEFHVCSGDYGIWTPVDENDEVIEWLDTLHMWGCSSRELLDADIDRNLHRPVLTAGNGDIVLVFVGQRDPEDVSQANVLNHDLYVTRSSDLGRTWYPIGPIEPADYGTIWENLTDLTATHTPMGAVGACKDEDYVSAWPWIKTDSILHLTYIMDLFSGPSLEAWDTPSSGYFTLNPIMYLGGTGTGADGRGLKIRDTVGVAETPTNSADPGIALVSSEIVSRIAIFRISAPAPSASLRIYDATGALVTEVFSGSLPEATTLTWDARKVPSGIYFYRFNTPQITETGRVTVLK